jgi:hypothetical protein
MIGSHPIKTAEKARGEAITKLGTMESGINPNEEKRQACRQEKEEKRQVKTLQDVLDDVHVRLDRDVLTAVPGHHAHPFGQ